MSASPSLSILDLPEEMLAILADILAQTDPRALYAFRATCNRAKNAVDDVIKKEDNAREVVQAMGRDFAEQLGYISVWVPDNPSDVQMLSRLSRFAAGNSEGAPDVAGRSVKAAFRQAESQKSEVFASQCTFMPVRRSGVTAITFYLSRGSIATVMRGDEIVFGFSSFSSSDPLCYSEAGRKWVGYTGRSPDTYEVGRYEGLFGLYGARVTHVDLRLHVLFIGLSDGRVEAHDISAEDAGKWRESGTRAAHWARKIDLSKPMWKGRAETAEPVEKIGLAWDDKNDAVFVAVTNSKGVTFIPWKME